MAMTSASASGVSILSTFAADSRGSVTLALKRTPSDGRVSLAAAARQSLTGSGGNELVCLAARLAERCLPSSQQPSVRAAP